MQDLEDIVVEHSLNFDFQTTNNQVEYEAFVSRLNLGKDMGVKSLTARSDLQLVVGHVNRTYETKVPCLNKYMEKVKAFLGNFDHFKLERIP